MASKPKKNPDRVGSLFCSVNVRTKTFTHANQNDSHKDQTIANNF